VSIGYGGGCCVRVGKEKSFTFDFSYNSFVPRDDPEYASQDTVWRDIGVGVLTNAYQGTCIAVARRVTTHAALHVCPSV
jgi:hypothetical protein